MNRFDIISLQTRKTNIEKVYCLFATGRFHFLLGNETACIRAYSHAIEKLLNGKYLNSQSKIASEMALAGRLKCFNPALAGQIQLYLYIAMALLSQGSDKTRFKNYLENFQLRKVPFKTPVVIVAGGASLMDPSKVDDYRDYIRELMHGFRGTIISGGTTAGIPGLAGSVKADMEKQHQPDFDLIAYLPVKLPVDAVKSLAYDQFYKTASEKFSALDILNCWVDLVMNGVNPVDVVLVGIDGGAIARMEYEIALSLGAKVALVSYSGRAVTDFLQDKIRGNHPNLLQLPDDPLTVWAMVNQSSKTTLSKEEIETQAPPLQNSELKQVALYEHILKRVNLGIRKADKPVMMSLSENLTAADCDLLAKLEHACRNAERLLDGWKYGPQKDLANKLNPCIISWDNLDETTRRYIYEQVDNIPVLLGKIGYEVFKM